MPFPLIPQVWLEFPTPCFQRGPCSPSFLGSTSKAPAQHQFPPPVLCPQPLRTQQPLLSNPWISRHISPTGRSVQFTSFKPALVTPEHQDHSAPVPQKPLKGASPPACLSTAVGREGKRSLFTLYSIVRTRIKYPSILGAEVWVCVPSHSHLPH